MYVCHCRAVTDRAIRAHIEQGAHDETVLAERCGAGNGCGGCLPLLRQLLADLPAAPHRVGAPA